MKVSRKSRTRQIIAATERQEHKAVSAGLEAGIEEMYRRVAEDKGHLKATTRSHDNGKGSGRLESGGIDGDVVVDYALPVEYGSVHNTENGTYSIPAQPYWRPGLDVARRTVKRNMKIAEK